jgi:cyclopropane fatty-acyl-phospholipid synthase-like methyltransferase
MDWPHDPDGEEGSEGKRKYGHAILAKKLDEEVDFPLTATEYVEEFGDHPVRIDYERVVSVADVFEHVDQEEYEDFPDFHKAMGRALRSAGLWPYELEHA